MQTLWNAMRRRWLDSDGPESGGAGVERLNDHLRRDIGLSHTDDGFLPAPSIRERNFSEVRSFLTLQAYR
jgi:hypothetical protein